MQRPLPIYEHNMTRNQQTSTFHCSAFFNCFLQSIQSMPAKFIRTQKSSIKILSRFQRDGPATPTTDHIDNVPNWYIITYQHNVREVFNFLSQNASVQLVLQPFVIYYTLFCQNFDVGFYIFQQMQAMQSTILPSLAANETMMSSIPFSIPLRPHM